MLNGASYFEFKKLLVDNINQAVFCSLYRVTTTLSSLLSSINSP